MKNKLLLSLFLLTLSAVPAIAQQKMVAIMEMKVGGLIGGVQNGKFVDAKTAAKSLKGGDSYDLFSMMGKEEGEMTGQKPENDMDVCTDFYYVKTDPEAKSGVSLSGDYRWNPVPRIPKSLSLTSAAYKKVAADFLKLNGIPKPVVQLTQLYSIDLDNDGVDEVILTATRYSNENAASAKTGDYSFTIVRKVVGGKVKNLSLGGDFIKKGFDFGAPNTYEVSAVIDLNGDGKMEIVHHGAYYEGSGSAVYEIKNGKAEEIKLLGAGCGV